MHFLKASLVTLLSLALTASSASVPSNALSQNLKFWENRISTYRQNHNLDDVQNKALDTALETLRNQDLDSYDDMKGTLISAFDYDEAKALFVPDSTENKLETRIRECECSTFDGSDCNNGWVCVDRPQDPALSCDDTGPIGGCGWGGLHGCIGVCVPP